MHFKGAFLNYFNKGQSQVSSAEQKRPSSAGAIDTQNAQQQTTSRPTFGQFSRHQLGLCHRIFTLLNYIKNNLEHVNPHLVCFRVQSLNLSETRKKWTLSLNLISRKLWSFCFIFAYFKQAYAFFMHGANINEANVFPLTSSPSSLSHSYIIESIILDLLAKHDASF